ncbi:MAG TPA: FAD-dependent oxidoreductase [Gaiellaceae bacterium]
MKPAFRVVIAGGGVAAIEAALTLREVVPERVALTIAAAAREFVYRPLAVLRPFRQQPTYRIELASVAADLDAELVAADAVAVDTADRQLVLSDGQRLDYDALLIAIGAQAEAVVAGGTLTPWDWGEGHAYRSILAELGTGEAKSVVFIVPAGLTWPLPLYELALLTSVHVRDQGLTDVSLSIVTPERAPLDDFGPAVSTSVTRLLEERGITLFAGKEMTAIEAGIVRVAGRPPLAADVTVAVPVIRARTLDGVPTDRAGFIEVDAFCRVTDIDNVFAAGDCTNQPLKQGGIAAQQADTAAAGIARLAGAPVEAEPFRPELHAVLLTGGTPLQLDQTGASPLVTGDPETHPEHLEKIVARQLMRYLTRTAHHPCT